MKAVYVERTGGPDVLRVVDAPEPRPEPTEVVVRNRAIGLNFIDTYQRSGLYPMKTPGVLGREAAGVIQEVGSEVSGYAVGDRVGYVSGTGAYADLTAVRSDLLVKLPDDLGFETAAASMLKGMTAEFLVRRIWPLSSGDVVLVHAAAGGVGSLLTQWLTHIGVSVIGTAGTEDKAALARRNGCAHVILYRTEPLAERVREITADAGVKVVYDSVGKATAESSLDSLAPRGLFVSFGNASGPVAPLAPLELSRRGSLFMTRPTLFDYIATAPALADSAAALFDVIGSGAVKVSIGQSFPLAQVRQAHEALEARATTGATVLIP